MINVALRREVATCVRQLGAEALRAWQQRDFSVEMKGAIDPVTEIDRATEEQLQSFFQRVEPGVAFVGEETFDGEIPDDAWIVDPIDGTVNFATGHPMFAINVVRIHKREAVYAFTFAPAMGEAFWAAKGEGAWCNGAPMHIRDCEGLSQAVGASGFPYWIKQVEDAYNNIEAFGMLLKESRAIRRGGCASLDLAYLAAGRFAFYWEPGLKPWDIVAGSLMVEEAGGIVSGYDGLPQRDWFSPILACTPGLHEHLVQILSPYDINSADLPRHW